MKIAVTTLYTPEIADFSEEAVKNFRMYCDLHGYDLFVYDKSLKQDLRGNWCKPKVLLNHIKDYDYVVWLDSDIAILDINRKLEDIIEPHKDKLFIATDDMGAWHINNGFMIFKNTKYIQDMLGILWKMQSEFTTRRRGDQKFFIDFLEQVKLPKEKYHLYPQSEICAPLLLKNDKSFSVHIMGIHINDVRKEYIKHINDQNTTVLDLKSKQKQFLHLKDKWADFIDGKIFGRYRNLHDWIGFVSETVKITKPPKEKYSCYNAGKKIGIVTLYTSEIADFGVHSEISIKQYAEKQGYTFHVYRETLDSNAHPNWSKPRAIMNHIDDHDVIIWMDADTIIFNPEKKFETILARCVPMKKVIACRDVGIKGSMLNSGVLMFRNHQYSKNIIKKWMAHECDKSGLYTGGGDQNVLCDILKRVDGFGHNTKIFPMNTFNTDPRLVDDDTFILHFMAYPHPLKKIFMSYWNS